jgi:xylulokinase
MSLLGVDVGTTGCKASAFSADGRHYATAYREYDIQSPQPGYAQLDADWVWRQVKAVIADVARQTAGDPIAALSVSSLGEAVVPVGADRTILSPSILNFDSRGQEFIEQLAASVPGDRLYRITGNTLGNHFSLTKILWLKKHQPDVYRRTHKFLPWSALVPFMLGADPTVDYSLAGRTLLFDVDCRGWSDELLSLTGLDGGKLPKTAPSGAIIGTVSPSLADELGLPPGVAIVTGAHDQCANALGCGVYQPGCAMFGFGTYHCIVVVFDHRQDDRFMTAHGLNTEYHAAPNHYVSFIYNHGGSLVKWYRDTFAAAEQQQARQTGTSIYPDLFSEMSPQPSRLLVLPHFAATGPPEFITDSAGVLIGLKLDTPRAEILRTICESTIFYLRQALLPLKTINADVAEFRAVGGGARSDAWLQIAADILQRPLTRPANTEAGTLGAAILSGIAVGTFDSPKQAADAMVRLERTFEPDPKLVAQYDRSFEKYCRLWPLMKDYLRNLSKNILP